MGRNVLDALPMYALPTECPLVYRPWASRVEVPVLDSLQRCVANASVTEVAPPHYHEVNHVYHANAVVELSYEEDRIGEDRKARLVVVGPQKVRVQQARPSTNLTVAVRFKAEGFGALTGTSPSELANRIVPAEEIFGDSVRGVVESALSIGSSMEKADRLQEFLASLGTQRNVDPIAARCMEAMASLGPRASVAGLAGEVGYSPRNLDRVFHQHFGLAPKAFLRLFRYWTARRMIMRRPDLPIGHVASAAGYYDEPHLCHEFRSIASITPRSLVCVLATDFVSPEECREYARMVGDRPDLPWNLDTPNGRFARSRLRVDTATVGS